MLGAHKKGHICGLFFDIKHLNWRSGRDSNPRPPA